MPYTPPSHRSPASSAPGSPDVSRRSSLQLGSRPNLPRSSSYLHKHRRTPSAAAVSDGSVSVGTITPQGTSDDLQGMVTGAAASVRQSPPPMTDERGMPKQAVISPPDSASSGSDDEGPQIRGRKLERLKDLREAVSQIPQPRTPSPERKSREPSENGDRQPVHFSFSTSSLGDLARGRKSHVRSATEPHAIITKSADSSLTGSEEDTDEDLQRKPQMVRKKSGELVRPALRPSHRRPSSMPGTPVFSKAVHFDSHLEHVRHFLQVDRPLAVSAGSSPVDNYDSDTEYPFPGDERRSNTRSPPYEWEILTSNFPHDSTSRKSLPVRLEKVWLSTDQKSLVGSIAVANLAFQKSVTCRFTLDYWKTTSEVVAEYSHEIRPRETPVAHDRFTFSIKLADTANLEAKTLFFCIRYAVNGQEFWDNNNSTNFQVDFRKKHLPQNGKNNFQGASSRPANGLPRSNRRSPTSNAPRPKSMPVTFDDFSDEAKFNDQPIQEYLGESGTNGLRLKSKSVGNLASDNITKGLTSPKGLAFANRYDFGASLSAAVQAARDSMTKDKDGLYMKANIRNAKPTPSVSPSQVKTSAPSATAPEATSPTPSLPSSSYEELVNKYCFFGSKQSSPDMKDGTMGNGRFNGSTGGYDLGTGSTNSSAGSPNASHHTGPATHHSLHLRDQTSYLNTGAFVSSPIVSPMRKMSPNNEGSASSTPRPSGSVRSTSPAFVAYAGTPPNESPYQMERFPWSGDAHAATAIRG
ncbi:Fc.00g106490.m01.CDS01 [Cosmosporella sp. VM-42]